MRLLVTTTGHCKAIPDWSGRQKRSSCIAEYHMLDRLSWRVDASNRLGLLASREVLKTPYCTPHLLDSPWRGCEPPQRAHTRLPTTESSFYWILIKFDLNSSLVNLVMKNLWKFPFSSSLYVAHSCSHRIYRSFGYRSPRIVMDRHESLIEILYGLSSLWIAVDRFRSCSLPWTVF